jgi:hypothetical protein
VAVTSSHVTFAQNEAHVIIIQNVEGKSIVREVA